MIKDKYFDYFYNFLLVITAILMPSSLMGRLIALTAYVMILLTIEYIRKKKSKH